MMGSTSDTPDQRCLAAIEAICGDDWCEDQSLSNLDRPDGDLKTAVEKLSEIYILAHSHVHGPYEAWRKRVDLVRTERCRDDD
jgi:hypothetical protein